MFCTLSAAAKLGNNGQQLLARFKFGHKSIDQGQRLHRDFAPGQQDDCRSRAQEFYRGGNFMSVHPAHLVVEKDGIALAHDRKPEPILCRRCCENFISSPSQQRLLVAQDCRIIINAKDRFPRREISRDHSGLLPTSGPLASIELSRESSAIYGDTGSSEGYSSAYGPVCSKMHTLWGFGMAQANFLINFTACYSPCYRR
jgi:hypothetical protein